MSLGLLLLRLVVGGVFVGHGAQKLFGVFGGGGLEGTAGFFESGGLRPGRLHAVLAGSAELGGGTAVLAGRHEGPIAPRHRPRRHAGAH